MKTALKIEHLNKSMGKRQILHDICFETYAGEVFGFLGPNGAGKTTTIKIIAGLLSLDDGVIEINGLNVSKQFEKAMANIGGIVENPEMYRYMTGMQNLQQYARMRKGVTQTRIDEVVALVGLTNRIYDKVGKYSLGMRQRLGVAQAILHRPQVLILDEPTNGLDPAGIKELRDILKNLAHEEGISVLVSSHLMSEMELMCDRVGIIVNGKLIDVQTVEELVSASMGDHQTYCFHVNDSFKAVQLLSKMDPETIKIVDEQKFEIILTPPDVEEQVSAVNALIVTNGIKLYSVAPLEKKKLEDVFIELTETGGNQIA